MMKRLSNPLTRRRGSSQAREASAADLEALGDALARRRGSTAAEVAALRAARGGGGGDDHGPALPGVVRVSGALPEKSVRLTPRARTVAVARRDKMVDDDDRGGRSGVIPFFGVREEKGKPGKAAGRAESTAGCLEGVKEAEGKACRSVTVRRRKLVGRRRSFVTSDGKEKEKEEKVLNKIKKSREESKLDAGTVKAAAAVGGGRASAARKAATLGTVGAAEAAIAPAHTMTDAEAREAAGRLPATTTRRPARWSGGGVGKEVAAVTGRRDRAEVKVLAQSAAAFEGEAILLEDKARDTNLIAEDSALLEDRAVAMRLALETVEDRYKVIMDYYRASRDYARAMGKFYQVSEEDWRKWTDRKSGEAARRKKSPPYVGREVGAGSGSGASGRRPPAAPIVQGREEAVRHEIVRHEIVRHEIARQDSPCTPAPANHRKSVLGDGNSDSTVSPPASEAGDTTEAESSSRLLMR